MKSWNLSGLRTGRDMFWPLRPEGAERLGGGGQPCGLAAAQNISPHPEGF